MKGLQTFMVQLCCSCLLLVCSCFFMVSCKKFVLVDPPVNTVVFATAFEDDKTATATGILGTQTLALNTHPLLVVDSGFGIFSRSGELTIGWLKESRVYLGDAGDDCRIIVLPDNLGQVQELINILKKSGESISQICVVKP